MKIIEYINWVKTSSNILDEVCVKETPLWRLIKDDWKLKHFDHIDKTTPRIIVIKELFYNFWKSFFCIIKICLSRKKYSNVFLPHPRLVWVGDMYMDRLTDPLIDCSGIGSDYLILERHQNGIHKRPRYHDDKVVYLDSIDFMTIVLTNVAKPILSILYKKQIRSLCDILKTSPVGEDKSDRNLISYVLTYKIIHYHLIKPVLNCISPQRFFMAPRTTYDTFIAYAKKRGIITVELQHGITLENNSYYVGSYNPQIDPDYFFVFGETCIGPQYAMPISRIINVGFPYKKFILHNSEVYSDNIILVVSEPAITKTMIDIICDLSLTFPSLVFHIRCHPNEYVNENELIKVSKHDNVKIVSNTIDSFCAVSQYITVVGENSSVLYEAMSMGRKVGRINYGGLRVLEDKKQHGGTIINNPDEFKSFMMKPSSDENYSTEIYSDFDKEAFDRIIN